MWPNNTNHIHPPHCSYLKEPKESQRRRKQVHRGSVALITLLIDRAHVHRLCVAKLVRYPHTALRAQGHDVEEGGGEDNSCVGKEEERDEIENAEGGNGVVFHCIAFGLGLGRGVSESDEYLCAQIQKRREGEREREKSTFSSSSSLSMRVSAVMSWYGLLTRRLEARTSVSRSVSKPKSASVSS